MLSSITKFYLLFILTTAALFNDGFDSMPGLEFESSSNQSGNVIQNRTLILCAATQNTSWTEAVTENHILWVQSMASADYRYVEDPHFGFEESHWNESDSTSSRLSEPFSMEESKRLQPHWLKIYLLKEFIAQETKGVSASYSHILWVDDDILFTSRVDLLKSLYKSMDGDTHLIIAKDVGHVATTATQDYPEREDLDMHNIGHSSHEERQFPQVNTGFMFFRISERSQTLLELVWEQRLSHLGFCENQSCLHEQDALNNLLDLKSDLGDDVGRTSPRVGKDITFKHQTYRQSEGEHLLTEPKIVNKIVKILEPYDPIEPSLNLNTVWRFSHTWKGELQPKNYRGDPLQRRWHWGDNMAHVSGMTRSCRQEMLLWLAKYVKQWVFLNGETPECTPLDSIVVFMPEYVSSPIWHPLASARCSREAFPIAGGNWILPRRTVFDLDAVLVAHTQNSLKNSIDPSRLSTISLLDQRGFQETGVGTISGAAYLWQLLPSLPNSLPYLTDQLLRRLTDATASGMERYWHLVLYTVQWSDKHFAEVDPEIVNHLSGFNVQKPCRGAYPHLSDESLLTSLQAHGNILDGSHFDMGQQKFSCSPSPYAQLSLAAIAQNPDVFTWVSPSGLSFAEYHTIAMEAVLRRPEQLGNVEPMIYLELSQGGRGGLAYYDLAMGTVCLEGSALQYVQKVSVFDEEDHAIQRNRNQDPAPLLLPPPSWARGSIPLVIMPGRHHRRQDDSHSQSTSGISRVWPWDMVDTTGKVSNRKHSHKRASYFLLARAAVHQDGFALKFVSVEDLSSPEKHYFILAKTAVAQNGRAFAFVNASAIGGAMSDNYYEIALKAVHSRGEAFWEIDTAFLSDIELIVLVLKAIHNGDPGAFKAFNAREAIKQRKGTYTELALLSLSGAGAESFRGAGLKDIANVMGAREGGGLPKVSTVEVLEFIDPGRLVGAKARYAMAEAVLRQDNSEEVWEQVEELFQQGMRKDDYDDLLDRYRTHSE